MKHRIIIQLDDANKRLVEQLVDTIYDQLLGQGLEYSVWVESYKSREAARGWGAPS